jgi:hypothetical protein
VTTDQKVVSSNLAERALLRKTTVQVRPRVLTKPPIREIDESPPTTGELTTADNYAARGRLPALPRRPLPIHTVTVLAGSLLGKVTDMDQVPSRSPLVDLSECARLLGLSKSSMEKALCRGSVETRRRSSACLRRPRQRVSRSLRPARRCSSLARC